MFHMIAHASQINIIQSVQSEDSLYAQIHIQGRHITNLTTKPSSNQSYSIKHMIHIDIRHINPSLNTISIQFHQR